MTEGIVTAAGGGWGQRVRRGIAELVRTRPLFLLAAGVVVGACGGGAAIFFDWLIHACQHLVLGGSGSPVPHLAALPWWLVLLIPAAGGLLVGPIVYGWAAEARGHGVPEVMEAVETREGRMRPRVAVAKSLASAITIGTGGSVGREGPVVQIGAALGSLCGSLPGMSAEQRRTLVGCGAAAGIAATFNAPIAGAFFALEVILGNFAISAFSPIVLASVVATVVSRAYFGNYPAFHVPQYELLAWWELGPYGVLGVACGLLAAGFISFLYRAETAFDRSPIPPLLRPAAGGAVVGALILLSPHLYGTGFHSIDALLHGRLPWETAAGLIGLKLAACGITLASGGSGGVFSPSLFIGAASGWTLGVTLGGLTSAASSPAAYALVGMGGLLAGATHAPIASMLVLFELTNDYGIILPLMLCVTVSTLVSRALAGDSIYTRKLRRRGVPLFRSADDLVMNAFRVRDVMHREVPCVGLGASFSEVVERFLGAPIEELYVTDPGGRLCGAISLHDIKAVLGDPDLSTLVTASDLMRPDVPAAEPDETLARCLQRFSATHRDSLPVVGVRDGGAPVGVIYRKDLLDLYDREVLRRQMLGVRNGADGTAPHVLPGGHRIANIDVPPGWAGKTLRELDLRQRTGATVIAVQRGGRDRPADPADPARPLRPGDVLVVLGTADQVSRVSQIAAQDPQGRGR